MVILQELLLQLLQTPVSFLAICFSVVLQTLLKEVSEVLKKILLLLAQSSHLTLIRQGSFPSIWL